MWDLAGHEIVPGGGEFDLDHGDPLVILHCYRCPDGSEKGWILWRRDEEDGGPIEHQPAIKAVVEHLRDDGVQVSEHVLQSALSMAALQDDFVAGLDLLGDHVD